MEVALVYLIGLALLALALACLGVARSHAVLGRELIVQGRSHRKQLAEQDEFTIAAMQMHQAELMGAVRELHVHGILHERGVTPYLPDPRSAVNAEVQAVMQALGVDRNTAVAWMLTRIADLQVDGADRTGHSQSGTGLPEAGVVPGEDRSAQ